MLFLRYTLFYITLLSLVGCSTLNNKPSVINKPIKYDVDTKKINNQSGCVAGNCVNGNGKYQQLYKGKLFMSQEGTFKNGKLDGKAIEKYYHSDENLQRSYDGYYKNGKFHGKLTAKTFYRGKTATITTSTYKNGKSEGVSTRLPYTRGKLTHKIVTNYHNGEKHGAQLTTSYDNSGTRTKVPTRYYNNGRLVGR